MAIPFSFNESLSAALVLGRVGTGKSTYIIKEASSYLADNKEESVLVLAASPWAADKLQKRLHACGAGEVAVTTPRALALRILGTQEAQAITGRKPHLLFPLDVDFLLEDLKTLGMKQGRMREMLKFFYRSWTELADYDPFWLSTTEEEGLHSLLKENLALRECVLEPEISNFACKVLQESNDLAKQFAYTHVLVDDFQMLNRASQLLCCCLAQGSITVTGDPAACVEVYDSYPYRAGLEELKECFPRTNTITLEEGYQSDVIQQAIERLCESEQLEALPARCAKEAKQGRIQTISKDMLQAEFRAIPQFVLEAQQKGFAWDDIVVAAPNANWAQNIITALKASGISAAGHENMRKWRGDFTKRDHSIFARLLCGLRLVACENDSLAWRSWCGFDDYLGASAAFIAIRKAALQQGMSFSEALDCLTKGTLPLPEDAMNTQKVIQAYEHGQQLCRGSRGYKGRHLLDYVAQYVLDDEDACAPEAFVALCQPECDSSALAMLQTAERAFEARLPHNAVAVLEYHQVLGLNPELLVVAGFVNGLIPKGDWFDLTKTTIEKQAKDRIKYATLVYAMVGSVHDTLLLSSFESAYLDDALRLNLKVNRIRIEEGRRIAATAPCFFQECLITE